jgi:allantoate deiminase
MQTLEMLSIMAHEQLAKEIMARADELAQYSEMPDGICRRYGTSEMRAVLDRVREWMLAAGLEVTTDAFGSLVGTYAGEEGASEHRPFVVGGHLDSVRDAGRYDGILGVLTGLAVIEHLHRQNRRLPFPVRLIAFAEEEGLRFNSTLVGSRAWTGLPVAEQLAYTDEAGISLREAIRAFGGDPDSLGSGEHPAILGFLETHIEQGPVLEHEDLPVGVVTSIVGSDRAEIVITGMAGHAGTVPMALRRDALSAAAELVLEVERIGRETPGLVATVGELEVRPGATNVIPGAVRLTCEVRHASGEVCAPAIRAIRSYLATVCEKRGTSFAWRDIAGYAATPCDPELVRLLSAAVQAEGVRVLTLASGAGHDAVNIGQIAPVSMLFVRCKEGISHNPAESINVADVEVAIRVMLGFLDLIASEQAG